VKDTVPISLGSLPAGINIDELDSELDLINRLTDIVRDYDPDILTGYEVQSSSWGYIIERARVHFGYIPPILLLI
jgi:DNA polymerase zeta